MNADHKCGCEGDYCTDPSCDWTDADRGAKASAECTEPERKKRQRCATGQHKDRLIRGGKRLECTVCGDSFPCLTDCNHFDCQWERDEPGACITGELGFGE